MKIKNLKIGADPELFLKGADGFVSSEGLIGGSKKEPIDIGNGCYAQEDNVAVEFNIPPASNVDEFVEFVEYSLLKLRDMIDSSLLFSTVASAEFDFQYLTSNSLIAGCAPDYNIWEGGKRNPEPAFSSTNVRATGGHIHFGYDNPTLDSSADIVKLADVFVTIPTLKYEDTDAAVQRRSLYGRAGSYRFKPYGVEYRTLSSWWLESKSLTKEVYERAIEIQSKLNKATLEEIDKDAGFITTAIDFHYKKSIEYIIDKYKIAS